MIGPAQVVPRATYRLQFHAGFTFADAERLVPYFAELGISHLYASPITVARRGSMHGYDVIDPTRINPELGGEEGFVALAATARAAGLGLVIDIVPNHMAADLSNPWWHDVLARGPNSPYAGFFDIDWDPADPELRGKVLLPMLGRPLPDVLTTGEITYTAAELRYFEHRFPLAAGTEAGPLAEVLQRQHYQLAYWRTASDRINWRRFFDINELVCLRMEEPAAFEAVHALPLQLYAEGLVDGLRIDHVDGLRDPAAYCRALRERLDDLGGAYQRPRAWLVVEKILLGDETLPKDWACDGTTGYDFMNDVSALQHAGDGEAVLAAAWSLLSGRTARFALEERDARRAIVARSFSAQLDACARLFRAQLGVDTPLPALRRVLTELLTHFPVYRTYGTADGLAPCDLALLRRTAEAAACTCYATDRWVLKALQDLFPRKQSAQALARLQQLSAPVAAKAVEDTAFYRYGRLLSRNDVGFDAATFALAPEAFHARVQARQVSFPHALLATATHDHKRGEDVRARLAVLREVPEQWTRLQRRWVEAMAPFCGALSPGDRAMLLQTLVGAWPFDLAVDDRQGCAAFATRLQAWQQKALREAKLHSDWAAIDEAYEAAAHDTIERLIVHRVSPGLLDEIVRFAHCIAPAGAVNGLAQCLLKLTLPGVPDIYQGTELWDQSLVDPDNRRPVDFDRRRTPDHRELVDLARDWRDGRLKQRLMTRALELRRRAPRLFAQGAYQPVRVEGNWAGSVLAFVRMLEKEWLLVVVPRLPLGLLGEGDTIALSAGAWKGTTLHLDDLPPSSLLYDWLGGGPVELLHRDVKPDLLCGTLPIALVSTVGPPTTC